MFHLTGGLHPASDPYLAGSTPVPLHALTVRLTSPRHWWRRRGDQTDFSSMATRVVGQDWRPSFPASFNNRLRLVAQPLSFDSDIIIFDLVMDIGQSPGSV